MQKLTLLLGAIALGMTMIACQPEPQGDTTVVVPDRTTTTQPGDVNVTIENEPPSTDINIDVPPPIDPGDESGMDGDGY